MKLLDSPFALPTAQQELLLRAALLQGAESIEAWRQWIHAVTIDDLESDSQWLLPLLYHNLKNQGVVHALMARYQNVYRHNWYKNQLLLHCATQLIHALVGAMPVVLLKGAGMALDYYLDKGARPLHQVDLLLPLSCSVEQIHTLATPQWSISEHAHAKAPSTLILTDGLRRSVILHRHLFAADLDSDVTTHVDSLGVDSLDVIDAGMRARATRLPHPRLNLFLLTPPDQWRYLCAHRSGWDPASTLLWFADAAQVVTRQNLPGYQQHASQLNEATVTGAKEREESSKLLNYLQHLDLQA